MTPTHECIRCIETLAYYFDRYAPDTLAPAITEAEEFLEQPEWLRFEKEGKELLGVMIGYAMRIAHMGSDGFEWAIVDSQLALGVIFPFETDEEFDAMIAERTPEPNGDSEHPF